MTKYFLHRTVLWIITLTCILPGALGSEPANITKFQSNPGIYFEEIGKVSLYSTEWQTVIYYDLSNFNLELSMLKDCEGKFKRACSGLTECESTRRLCLSLSEHYSNLINEISERVKLIQGKEKRQRRGLFNAVGSLSKTLFGTLDDDDAQKYNEQIETIKTNQDHLLLLIKNQTLIVETTANIFNKTRTDIIDQFNLINTKFRKIEETTNKMDSEFARLNATLELETLSSLIVLISTRFQSTLNILLDLVTDVRHGKPHPSIITPKQVDDLLTSIQKNLPKELTLPVDRFSNSILQIYRLGQISTAIVGDKIIFNLKIPLPLRESYQLYKVVPLPTRHNNDYVFIQPSLEFLVVDYNREHYYSLNKMDLNNCLTDDLEDYLCRIVHPIFNVHSENNLCEIDLLKHDQSIPSSCNVKSIPCNDFWIQLAQPNKWLFVMDRDATVDIICNDKIFPRPLQGAGIIELRSGCYLRSKELVLQAHNVQTSRLNNYYLPTINITEEINTRIKPNQVDSPPKIAKTVLLKYNNENELRDLSTAIGYQKKQEAKGLHKINAHDIHHYSMSYGLLALLIIVFAILAQMKWKCATKTKDTNDDIDLQDRPTESSSQSYTIGTHRNK